MKREEVEREYLRIVALDICLKDTDCTIECLGFMKKGDPYLYVKMLDTTEIVKGIEPSHRYIKVAIWNTKNYYYFDYKTYEREMNVAKFVSSDFPETIFWDKRIKPVVDSRKIEKLDYISRKFSKYTYGRIIKYAPKRRVTLKINIEDKGELICYGYSTSKYLYVRLHPTENKYTSNYACFYLKVLREDTEKSETVLPGFESRQINVEFYLDSRLQQFEPFSTSDIDFIIELLYHEQYEYVGALGFGEWKRKSK